MFVPKVEAGEHPEVPKLNLVSKALHFKIAQKSALPFFSACLRGKTAMIESFLTKLTKIELTFVMSYREDPKYD